LEAGGIEEGWIEPFAEVAKESGGGGGAKADGDEKIGILPLRGVGFAQMPLIWWASLKCLY